MAPEDATHEDSVRFWREFHLIVGRIHDGYVGFSIGLLTQKEQEHGRYPSWAAMWDATRKPPEEFFRMLNG